jgi:hypothetical protein
MHHIALFITLAHFCKIVAYFNMHGPISRIITIIILPLTLLSFL